MDDRLYLLQGSSTCCRSKGRKPRNEPFKRGLNTKVHLAVDAHGLPIRAIITEDVRHDVTQAEALIDRLEAEYVFADRAYDINATLAKIEL